MRRRLLLRGGTVSLQWGTEMMPRGDAALLTEALQKNCVAILQYGNAALRWRCKLGKKNFRNFSAVGKVGLATDGSCPLSLLRATGGPGAQGWGNLTACRS